MKKLFPLYFAQSCRGLYELAQYIPMWMIEHKTIYFAVLNELDMKRRILTLADCL